MNQDQQQAGSPVNQPSQPARSTSPVNQPGQSTRSLRDASIERLQERLQLEHWQRERCKRIEKPQIAPQPDGCVRNISEAYE